MRLLLDTHVFLWFIAGSQRLSKSHLDAIRDPANEVFLIAISVWECMVKHQLGKLVFHASPDIYIPTQRKKHLIASLPLEEQTAAILLKLPQLHRDPFDRMLVCQAIHHDLVLATVDDVIRAYPIKTL